MFKDSAISFSHPHQFSDKYGTGILKTPFYNYYSLNDWPQFILEENEFSELEKFYESYKELKQNKDLIRRMVELWLISRKTPYFDVKFILHVTILEMFIESNTELNYRLSRSIAVFLGVSKEDSEKIFENMKKLYNARSKYLHDGAENREVKNEINAQHYAREMIVKLISFSSELDSSIEDIRSEINKLGFGDCKLLEEIFINRK